MAKDEKNKVNDEENVQETVDVEIGGDEIDAVTSTPGVPSVIETLSNEKALEAYEFVAANIDRLVIAQRKIREGIYKIALPGDWVVFGSDGDSKKAPEDEVANLSYGGCTRIVNTLRTSVTNRSELQRIPHKDEKGDWYEYRQSADFSWNGILIKGVMGVVSTRDKFFGKAYGKIKDVWDVQEHWVARACHRAVIKEGVKLIFGLHQIPVKDLKAAGVHIEDAKSYKFNKSNDQQDPSVITPPQVKRLFQILEESTKAGLCTEQALRDYLKKKYNLVSTKLIKKSDYENIINFIKGIEE